ncbi:RNA polymerase sigma-70 factor [Photobacterium sp. SKA34]|jgi:RNA polymerase sigma-70 factor (ECF subfamily)|uniref:sigma-70 family RNA polymerase sigma factor n=1 Tax=Photobacterium sp. SKA34 TaxID=121723 RepID=UPI00006B77FA|nr:sigma-70 family RNA polymerase sigma factor [Photobacterium sp. SKA34]EAR55778.1 RNA polymerase sigma-70 factor [Photobacterium sp. SKA34]
MNEISIEHQKKLLVNVATDRDKTAFATIFSHFSPKIRSYGLKHLKQEANAMELVQETMLTVWRKAHLFNPDKGAVSTWVYTIMRNQCFDILRKRQATKEDNYSDDIWPIFEQKLVTASDDPSNEQLSDELIILIATLPKNQQVVVKEIYLNQRSHQELADQLGLPVGTVKSRLRLGLQKLRLHLENDDAY